jgi:hypothetical protein
MVGGQRSARDLARASSLTGLAPLTRHFSNSADDEPRIFYRRREEGKIFYPSSRAASPRFLFERRAQPTLQKSAHRALEAPEVEWREGAPDELK